MVALTLAMALQGSDFSITPGFVPNAGTRCRPWPCQDSFLEPDFVCSVKSQLYCVILCYIGRVQTNFLATHITWCFVDPSLRSLWGAAGNRQLYILHKHCKTCIFFQFPNFFLDDCTTCRKKKYTHWSLHWSDFFPELHVLLIKKDFTAKTEKRDFFFVHKLHFSGCNHACRACTMGCKVPVTFNNSTSIAHHD